MQGRILKNLLQNIQNLKQEYSKSLAKDNEYGDNECFIIEEKLYKFINNNFRDYYEEKMKLVEEVIKNHKEIWEKAFLYKSMRPLFFENKFVKKENKEISEEDKETVRYIYNNLLCQYFGLNFLAENHFSRETIFNHSKPYNSTFANFRFAGDIGHDFHLILDDLQNQLQMKYKNLDENDAFYNKRNMELFDRLKITDMERKVLELYLKNIPTKEISKILVATENTINTHIKSIRRKFKEKFSFEENEEKADIKKEIYNIIIKS